MVIRIILGIALIVFAAGFIWFVAQVIWLGTKEFFRIHSKPTTAAIDEKTSESKAVKTTEA